MDHSLRLGLDCHKTTLTNFGDVVSTLETFMFKMIFSTCILNLTSVVEFVSWLTSCEVAYLRSLTFSRFFGLLGIKLLPI